MDGLADKSLKHSSLCEFTVKLSYLISHTFLCASISDKRDPGLCVCQGKGTVVHVMEKVGEDT